MTPKAIEVAKLRAVKVEPTLTVILICYALDCIDFKKAEHAYRELLKTQFRVKAHVYERALELFGNGTGCKGSWPLIGDRRIGKSSVASFIRYFAEKNKDMLGVHVFLGSVTDLNDVVCHVFEEILKKSKGESWFENIRKLFGTHIKEVGLLGISISFKPPRDDLQELTKQFPEALSSILNEIQEQKKGLFIEWTI